MWVFASRVILRNRIPFLVFVGCLAAFMAYQIPNVQRDFKITGILPDDHPVTLDHLDFIDQYGHDGSAIVIGVQTDSMFNYEHYSDWRQLGIDISAIDGIDSVFSMASMYKLKRNDSIKKFEVFPLFPRPPANQADVDSIQAMIEAMPFYANMIMNDTSNVHIMMVFLDGEKFNSNKRGTEVEEVAVIAEEFGARYNLKVRFSGLPYIRTVMTNKVKVELNKFIILAFSVTALILFLFFRSLKVVFFSMLVVSVGVVVSLGSIALFEFKLSMLMGLIPPLMIVIGIPNSVYLLNKYQADYMIHGNKIKAMSRVIQKVGNATFMTNTTTALGFATFIFTQSSLLQEFGIIASINIMVMFFISIFLIPIIFSYLPGPGPRSTKHLDTRWLKTIVNFLVHSTTNHRKLVYLTTVIVVGLGFYGLSRVVTTGSIVDDLPYDDPILADLNFFEDNFKGVMPFEILVDTKEPKKAVITSTLKKIEALQGILQEYPEFSRSVSVADAVKFAHQSFYDNPTKYFLPDRSNTSKPMRDMFNLFMKKTAEDAKGVGNAFLDSTGQTTRIAVSVADIGTIEMDSLLDHLKPRIDSIFNPDRPAIDSLMTAIMDDDVSNQRQDSLIRELFENYSRFSRFFVRAYTKGDSLLEYAVDDNFDTLYTFTGTQKFMNTLEEVHHDHFFEINLTGTSIVFLEGTNYLVKNLFISLVIAICIIAVMMALLFNSLRMVLVSLIPNLIPLLFTGAIMGYFGVPIKPSTILVFSIAFGISIDDTIHFLAKYRQELKSKKWDIKASVIDALKETGVSMIYTSIILFFGFIMFSASSFGGIVALGILVATTLILAMLTNLVLLPSLLLSLEKSITTKAFKEPLLEILDEEEDIELDELEVKRENPDTSSNPE